MGVESSHELERSVAARLASLLYHSGAVRFDIKGGTTLSSGIRSPIYIDSRLLFSAPGKRREVAAALFARAAAEGINYDVVAGTAVGGISPALLLAEKGKKGFVFVRATPKSHGTKKRIEGESVIKKRTLLVEDVVVSGGSSIAALKALKDEGAEITDVIALVSYNFPGARAAFAKEGVRLHALTTVRDIIDEARVPRASRREILNGDYEALVDWLKREGRSM